MLIQTIYEVHEGLYGFRRIHDELMNVRHKLNHKEVYRLMNELDLKCPIRMKKILFL
ncbi:hypothetical protein IIE_05456 [Bacillus cereus VD045]|nr:hypothetical protein IIE_05456 [Bacillus cereus VD045]HDR4350997.1 transposase [Bacillus cereus]HDR6958085.1 transposase [Bacillus cereus]